MRVPASPRNRPTAKLVHLCSRENQINCNNRNNCVSDKVRQDQPARPAAAPSSVLWDGGGGGAGCEMMTRAGSGGAATTSISNPSAGAKLTSSGSIANKWDEIQMNSTQYKKRRSPRTLCNRRERTRARKPAQRSASGARTDAGRRRPDAHKHKRKHTRAPAARAHCRVCSMDTSPFGLLSMGRTLGNSYYVSCVRARVGRVARLADPIHVHVLSELQSP